MARHGAGGGTGDPSASTQHHCGGSQRAGAWPWAAATGRRFASQPGKTCLHPAGGTCPLAPPPHCIIQSLFGVFLGFWRRQCEGAAIPSSLLNQMCLGHCLAAASRDGRFGLGTLQMCPQACKQPNRRGGTPAPQGACAMSRLRPLQTRGRGSPPGAAGGRGPPSTGPGRAPAPAPRTSTA